MCFTFTPMSFFVREWATVILDIQHSFTMKPDSLRRSPLWLLKGPSPSSLVKQHLCLLLSSQSQAEQTLLTPTESHTVH